MIEAAVEVDFVELILDEGAVVDEDLDGDQHNNFSHIEVEGVADVLFSLITILSVASVSEQSKAYWLLTVRMKEAKQERLEKEVNHNARINNHLRRRHPDFFFFSRYFCFQFF